MSLPTDALKRIRQIAWNETSVLYLYAKRYEQLSRKTELKTKSGYCEELQNGRRTVQRSATPHPEGTQNHLTRYNGVDKAMLRKMTTASISDLLESYRFCLLKWKLFCRMSKKYGTTLLYQ